MSKIKSGFAFHVHHNKLAEWCYGYNERVMAIKGDKPIEEQELRLHLFKLIPQDRVPIRLLEARKTYDKAREIYHKVEKAYHKAGEIYYKAWGIYYKEGEAYDKVMEAYYKVLEILHQELCPNCPFDGETLWHKTNWSNVKAMISSTPCKINK